MRPLTPEECNEPTYKKIAIQAWDVKPGDIITGRIATNRWPNIMTVKSVTLTSSVVKIMTASGFVYNFLPEHMFIKELSPAEEGEMALIDQAADEGPYGRNK